MRLVVAVEQRLRLGDVGPLGEALAPPVVVFRDRVELRQVEGDQAGRLPGLLTVDSFIVRGPRVWCQRSPRRRSRRDDPRLGMRGQEARWRTRSRRLRRAPTLNRQRGCRHSQRFELQRPAVRSQGHCPDHHLIDIAEAVACQRLRGSERQLAPAVGELGLLWSAYHEIGLDDLEAGIANSFCMFLSAPEADVGPVQQAPGLVGEILVEQSRRRRRCGPRAGAR